MNTITYVDGSSEKEYLITLKKSTPLRELLEFLGLPVELSVFYLNGVKVEDKTQHVEIGDTLRREGVILWC